MLEYIIWNPNPEIVKIGSFSLLWYGVLFAIGLVLAGWYVWLRFKQFEIPQKQFENLIIWAFFGIFIGARLCHCLFYEPEYFLSHPVEMFLPLAQDVDGGYYFSGYHGLASHGGGVGLIIAILLFKLTSKAEILPIMDFIAIATPLAGGFIRLGNLMNSEIIGSVTNVPWAFVFSEVDDMPRHPAQLYEAIFYFVLFAVLAFVFYKCGHDKVKKGFYLAVILIIIPLFRFFIEFVKEVQVDFENSMILNMGQLLSVPLMLAGCILLLCIYLPIKKK